MRRLEAFILVCLPTLSACGGETGGLEPVQTPPPPDGREDVTVYDCDGLEVGLPN